MAKKKTQTDNQMKDAEKALYNAMWHFTMNEATLRREAISRILSGTKDINYECGYPTTISVGDYRTMYDREGIAKRVVRILPEESWAQVPEIYEDEDPTNKTKFEEEWQQLQDRLHVFQFMQRIDVLSGIGRFGILILGLDDGKELNQPVEGINEITGEKVGTATRKLLYLKALDESSVSSIQKESERTSPRYGEPKKYSVTYENTSGTGDSKKSAEVHWTRVIHVADNRDSSEVHGTPRMKPVYNRLLDIRKVLSGSAEMFWKGGFPGYAAEIDPSVVPESFGTDTQLRADIKKELKEEVELWQNSMQRVLVIAGMKFKSLQPQVADPKGHVDTHIKAIAISLGIPYRIFLGTEEAKLASTQDVRTWNKRLANRQNQYLTPMLIRPFIDRLIALGALSEPKQYFVEWPDLEALTDKEQAEINKDKTEALAKYALAGIDQYIPPLEYLTMYQGMSKQEAVAVIEAAAQREPPIDEGE